MILCIKADTQDVVVELRYESEVIGSKQWQAGRELSTQIHSVIDNLCRQVSKSIADISGVIVYEGPGSYTGLRIGVSVANALGYSMAIPVVGVTGDNWQDLGQTKLQKTTKFIPIAPVYGGQVYTTTPKK